MSPYLRTFTLDTNCWIAIEEGRLEGAFVRTLSDAHAAGTAHVSVVAISASEKQQDGRYIHDFKEFRDRLTFLGLAHLEILRPMAYWDVTFWDWSLWSDPTMETLEQKIHAILFPNVEFAWQDYCAAQGLNPKSPPAGRWRNCKCDVQVIWTHIHNQRDVFVTTDKKFHGTAKRNLLALGAKQIEYPNDAANSVKI